MCGERGMEKRKENLYEEELPLTILLYSHTCFVCTGISQSYQCIRHLQLALQLRYSLLLYTCFIIHLLTNWNYIFFNQPYSCHLLLACSCSCIYCCSPIYLVLLYCIKYPLPFIITICYIMNSSFSFSLPTLPAV